MQRRVMDALQGGETECLTQNYWTLHSITFSKKSSDEDIFRAAQEFLPLLKDEEIRYLYWEMAYSRHNNIRGHLSIMREYLLSEHMDRKCHLGRYKQ